MPTWIVFCIIGGVIIVVLQVLPLFMKHREKDKHD